MKAQEMSVQDIKDLMEAFHRNKLGSLEIQQGDFALKLESQKQEPVILSTAAAAPATGGAYPPAAGGGTEPEVYEPAGNVVPSPIVGTFYAAPAPDKDPYVRVGSKVAKGDVLFIIESMKLMNEVTSELDGTVTEILVENAQGVEYGQPILVIE